MRRQKMSAYQQKWDDKGTKKYATMLQQFLSLIIAAMHEMKSKNNTEFVTYSEISYWQIHLEA